MRKRCLETIYRLAKNNSDIVFIGSDLGAGTLDKFRQEMPDRFFMEGISESHAVGMASGLALSGKKVFVNTIASFLTRRCYEQNVIDLGLSNSNVILIGNGGGVVYAPLGPTHLATEDIGIMSSIPNMKVIVPADADEMENAIIALLKSDGPAYIRVAKGNDPIVSNKKVPFKFGEPIVIKQPGDIVFFCNGTMVSICLSVANMLEAQGYTAGVINLPCVKPINSTKIVSLLSESTHVFTAEEHLIDGGIGSAIATFIAESSDLQPLKFKRFGLPDQFFSHYGSQNEILSHYGLDEQGILSAVLSTLPKMHLSHLVNEV